MLLKIKFLFVRKIKMKRSNDLNACHTRYELRVHDESSICSFIHQLTRLPILREL